MPDRFYGTCRIVRLAILRRSYPNLAIGAYRFKVWPSSAIGHRDTRCLFFTVSRHFILRLIYRTATTTASQCRRLGIVH
jgi:hypothetical protein